MTIRRVPLVLSSYERARTLAGHEVNRAIREGRLPRLRNVNLPCVDCGKRAENWDHRNYNKPLKVEAVCHSCNLLRGKASFTPETLEVPMAAISCPSCNYQWVPRVSFPKKCPNSSCGANL